MVLKQSRLQGQVLRVDLHRCPETIQQYLQDYVVPNWHYVAVHSHYTEVGSTEEQYFRKLDITGSGNWIPYCAANFPASCCVCCRCWECYGSYENQAWNQNCEALCDEIVEDVSCHKNDPYCVQTEQRADGERGVLKVGCLAWATMVHEWQQTL